MKRLVLIIAAVGVAVGLGVMAAVALLTAQVRESFYPQPPALPAPVEQPVEQLLARLEEVLAAKAPAVRAALRPGLTDREIAEQEAQLGVALGDDLRALYRWHDGIAPGGPTDFIPGHRFLPLAEAVALRRELRAQEAAASPLQRVVGGALVGHREGWLPLLDDRAGDGYFYDPDRAASDGAYFYYLAEDSYYRFYPSLGNLLAGVLECWERGAYHVGEAGGFVQEAFDATPAIWRRYGTEVR